MQAVILVGGRGTRLRPLTSSRPKPVITLVDRPFMAYMLEWLAGHGVTDIIMSCGFEPSQIEQALGDGSDWGVSLRYVVEPQPRGTAGALKECEHLLDERFLVLNGDILTDVDLGAQIADHGRSGATATLGLVPVDDPSAYGLVITNGDGSVHGFLEKPGPDELGGMREYLISAGIYVLERRILELIPLGRPVSIEREVWPRLVGDGLYATAARDSYWIDIGTPERYLKATCDILDGEVRTAVLDKLGPAYLSMGEDLDADGRIVPPAMIGRGVTVGRGSHIGSLVVLGDGVTVGEQSRIERCVVLDGARVGDRCEIEGSIIAAGAVIGDRVTVRGRAIVGEGVQIGSGNELAFGVRLFPGTVLGDDGMRF